MTPLGLQTKPKVGKAEKIHGLTESMHKSNEEDDVILDDVTPGFHDRRPTVRIDEEVIVVD